MYYLYILKSNKIERFYIGVSKDLRKRLLYHNNGKVKSTKGYRPWLIVYTEQFKDKSLACKREWYLKHPAGYQDKLNIIKNLGLGEFA